MTRSFTLTGRHVLAILLGFFLMIVVANSIFITLAVKSFPGEQEKKSYLQGLNFNDRLAERDAQAALGWAVELTDGFEGDRAVLDLQFLSDKARPVTGLAITGALARPATQTGEREFEFFETAPGVYRAEIEDIDAGAWLFEASAAGRDGEVFRLRKRLEWR